MITAGLGIKIAFLIAVALIWMMILYQIVMTFAGFVHRIRSHRLTAALRTKGGPLPPVTILVPARNEAVVIADTLRALRTLEYGAGLEIVIVDDGSTDATASIVREIAAEDARVRVLQLPVQEQGRGKSHALNIAFREARHELIAIYDADNRPEPGSLEILVRRLLADESLGAVLGKFRTINRGANLLTRFINLETLAFQWIVQAGRCALFGVGTLPGTNFVIRKRVLAECDGWDEKAITEDTELSIRIYENGWKIDFAPEAVSWEEEPEKFGVWLKQRTRWVRGNFYVLRKFLRTAWEFKNKFLALQLLYLSLLYYFFLFSVIVSHFVFLACVTGFLRIDIPGPYNAVWASAVLLFVAELWLVTSYEEEHSARELGIALLMYVTYCQAWLLVVFRALWREYVVGEGSKWDKTVRSGTVTARPPQGGTPGGGASAGLVLCAALLLGSGARGGDSVVEAIRGDAELADAAWGELYMEAVREPSGDSNVAGFVDLKDGARVARVFGAELFLYGKARAYKDVNGDYWNNKATYGPGVRLKPFTDWGLYFFAEYLWGNYYGIENKDPNPYAQSFDGVEGGAAFWQRWGARPDETAFFLPFTGYREVYWDAIYIQRDDDNIIANVQGREGLGCLRLGPLASDLYLRLDANIDRNKDYWNNRLQGGLGVRFRPVLDNDVDLQLSCEVIAGVYNDRHGRYELPYDEEYVGARLELTYWFGW
jgi:cellulose synthase/poly-beta-1,6-N-acetylglucosamine synthase-like glycosyltransferase